MVMDIANDDPVPAPGGSFAIPPPPAPATLEAQGKALLKSKTMAGLALTLLGLVMPRILKAIHAPPDFTTSDAMVLVQQTLTYGGLVMGAYGRLVAKQRIA